MKVAVGPAWTYVEEADTEEMRVLTRTLRARPKGYFMMPKYKSGVWDGFISLITHRQFPTGLIGLVSPIVQAIGAEFQWAYDDGVGPQLPWTPPAPGKLRTMTLNEDQLRMATSCGRWPRGVLEGATGSGKTVVMMEVIADYGIPKTLVLQNRQLLVDQTADRFEDQLGIEVGRIMAGRLSDQQVIVATGQTLATHPDQAAVRRLLESIQLLIIDEAHNASAEMYAAAYSCERAWHRFAFTGTADMKNELENMKVTGITGPVLSTISIAQQVKTGRAPVPHVFTRTVGSMRVDGTDWRDIYRKGVVYNTELMEAVCEDAKFFEDRRLPFVIQVNDIEHGELMQAATGLPFISGSTPLRQRQKKLDELSAGQIAGVIATTILDEGVDVPNIYGMILAGQMQSPIRLLQRLGRLMRKKDGHKCVYVVDYMNLADKTLKKHSNARQRVWRSREGIVVHRLDERLRLIGGDPILRSHELTEAVEVAAAEC